MPTVTDRKLGMCSVKTVMPLGSLVHRTSSIMYGTIPKLEELTTAPHPSTPESGVKAEPKSIRQRPRCLTAPCLLAENASYYGSGKVSWPEPVRRWGLRRGCLVAL